MDFNRIASDIVAELKQHAKQSDKEIAERLGISRQAYLRRRDTNSLTTENLTVLSAWLVTWYGGGFYIDKIFSKAAGGRVMTQNNKPSVTSATPSSAEDAELQIARGIRNIVDLCTKEILVVSPERKAKTTEAVLNIIAAYGRSREKNGELLGRLDEWLRLNDVVNFTKKRNKAVYKLQLPLEYVQVRTKELKALQQLKSPKGEE